MKTKILPITFFFYFLGCFHASEAQISGPISSMSDEKELPTCGTDRINHLHSQNNEGFKKDLEHFKNVVVPHLASLKNLTEDSGNILTIPTVVHIIHNGEPIGQGQNLSTERIVAQIDVLNQDFAALNPEFANTPTQWTNALGTPNIQFCLASVDPMGNSTDGIDRQQITVTGDDWQNNNINSEIKPTLNWNPDHYLNIYVLPIPGTTAQGGVVGFSNFPTMFSVGAPTDGPVIDYRWFGAPGFGQSGYRTITHEMGHYLGLPHPFEGDSCNDDDGLADTPNIEEPTRNLANLNCSNTYPSGPVSCGNEHMYVNYMDYTNENCYTSFTQEQVNVMRAVLDGTSQGFGYGSRKPLVDHAAIACILAENDAGILEVLEPSPRVCSNDSIAPIVTLRNFGTEELKNVYVSYQIDGEAPIDTFWQGSLASGSNLSLTLDKFVPPTGVYEFKTFTHSPNGVMDERMANDTVTVNPIAFVPVGPPVLEDMEGEMQFPTTEGYFRLQINPIQDNFAWLIANGLSAFGDGNACLFFNNFDGTNDNNPFGTTDAIISPHFDLSDSPNAQLTFDVAYAPFDETFSDSLIILAAINCSINYDNLLYFRGGDDLGTSPPVDTFWIPNSTNWRTEIIDLSQFAGVSDISFAFINLSGWGNNLFLDNIEVSLPCSMVLSAESEDATCFGDCNGTALVTVMDGGDNLTYEWSDGQTEPMASNLCAGNYEVTVTDEFGCALVTSVVVSEPSQLEASVNASNETAYNASDGTANADVTGGNSGYAYMWSNGQNTSSINNLSPGNYSLTVTDSKGCQVLQSFEIEAYDCSSFGASVQSTSVSCYGGTDGTANANPQGGSSPYLYIWSNGSTNQQISNLPAGTYSVTITDDSDCPFITTIEVTQPDLLEVDASATSETGSGANDGTATAFPSGGTPPFSALWSNGQGGATISNLPPGNYAVTITDDNDCTTTASVTVNSFDCGGFGASVNAEDISCFGAMDGQASVSDLTGATPFTFSWDIGLNDQIISNLGEGTYQVTVTDANDCGTVLTTTILEPTEINLNLNITDETGNNSNDGIATTNVNGGTQPYTYLWSNNQTTNTVTNLAPGNYSVTVTDANNCTITQSFIIDEFICVMEADLEIENATCPNAADGMVVVTVENGTEPYNISWSNGSSGAVVNNLQPGFYIVTVEDANGCDDLHTFQIMGFDNEDPTVLAQNIVVELDDQGMATVSTDMVDNGSFDNCGISSMSLSQSSFDCQDIGDITVTFTVEDENGNTSSQTVTITVEDNLPPALNFCPTDMVFMDCEGEIEYDLPQATDNCGNLQIDLIEGIGSGGLFPVGETIETYQISDIGGNMVECSFSIILVYDLEASFEVTEPTCFGFSDGFILPSATGGIPPYQFNFSGGGDPVNLSSGIYFITLTDAEGCAIIEMIQVEEPEDLTITIGDVVNATNGTGGSIEVFLAGGTSPYSLDWYLDGNLLSDADPTNLAPGDYEIVVNDENGCQVISEMVTVDNMVRVNNTDLEKSIRVFPNPTDGAVFVSFDLNESVWVDIKVLDLTGKLIHPVTSEQIDSSTFMIEIGQQNPGVYLFKILIDENLITKRVVLLH